MEARTEFDVDSACKWLVQNSKKKKKDIDKHVLKIVLKTIREKAHTDGLEKNSMKILAHSIVFSDSYDIVSRQNVLYSLIPEDDFPYELIPAAISDATKIEQSSSWQHSLLSWVGALLEYHIIDENHKLIHICYEPLVNLASHITLCSLACKILYYITTRQDVSPLNANHFMELTRKISFGKKIAPILRLYRVFRPDLMTQVVHSSHRLPKAPKVMVNGLEAASNRLNGNLDVDPEDKQNLFPPSDHMRRKNPYTSAVVVPPLEIISYRETLEEKKEKRISVLQYKKFKAFIRGMHEWKQWEWPNAASSMLHSPALIVLFRPHETRLKIAISDWLELALRTEVIERANNVERIHTLLKAAAKLIQKTDTRIPVLNHFVAEFLEQWDGESFIDLILPLISGMPYISAQYNTTILLDNLMKTLTKVRLSQSCAILSAITDMVCNWCLDAKREEQYAAKGTIDENWPLDLMRESALEGIWFVSHRLERCFLCLMELHKFHPMIQHSILDYYTRVQMYLNHFELAAFVNPPTSLVLCYLVAGDLVIIDRLGHLFCRLKKDAHRVNNSKPKMPEGQQVQQECLHRLSVINLSIILLLDGLYNFRAFTRHWRTEMASFVSEDSMKKLIAFPNFRKCFSLTRNLACLPLMLQKEYLQMENEEDKMISLMEKLLSNSFTGLAECLAVFGPSEQVDFSVDLV
ncbi:centromere protein I-like [Oratosquilla oratoria]|uniref:centromere protein I-like n=1 Tax=Oratosquilla oratoria TaxID=337810 RepID=UPI003F75C832